MILCILDSANSSQKPQSVIDRVNEFYTNEFSNTGRSVHYLAVAATNLYETYYDLLFKSILTLKTKMKLFLQKVQQKQSI